MSNERITIEELTAAHIEACRQEALKAGDTTLVSFCDAAAAGQFMAKQVVIGALQPKRPMR